MFTLLLQPKLNTTLMSWLEFVYFLHMPHGYANSPNHCSAPFHGAYKKPRDGARELSMLKHSTAFSYLAPQVSTKASNAANASFLVSAIQIYRRARLAFDCWLFDSLFKDVSGLVHPTALATCLRPDLFDRLPEAERAIGDRELGAHG